MDENNNTAAASFDGILKGWPKDGNAVIPVPVCTIPTTENEFLLYMTCELFKNQYLNTPYPQAEECFSYAQSLMSVLKTKKLLS